ncbi:NAD(P)-binding oxidoreductase [Kribbella sp. NPDC005582]|uniref:NAD(P)-dependent oxidoreductase n=1 Tax=Kribbella sp. NPDC005582 TaxID=3156893 RepID=UPI0033BAB54B
MKIAVLGATGQTGRHLVAQAVDRGHEVTALARTPSPWPGVRVVQADVSLPETILAAVADADVVLSALGVVKGQDPRILSEGAALVASSGRRLIWLGALGAGATTGALGPVNNALLRKVLHDWQAKQDAEQSVLTTGGTVIAAGILTNRPYQSNGHLVPAPGLRRHFPPLAPRAGIATLMLTEAEHPTFPGGTAVALFG